MSRLAGRDEEAGAEADGLDENDCVEDEDDEELWRRSGRSMITEGSGKTGFLVHPTISTDPTISIQPMVTKRRIGRRGLIVA